METVRVNFLNGMTSFVKAPTSIDDSGFVHYPETFQTGRPNIVDNLMVHLRQDWKHRMMDGKMIVYEERREK